MAGPEQEQTMARRFIAALAALEERRELEPIVAVYADGCEVGNVVSPRRFSGPEGAREFWSTYRETFGEMKSEFRTIVETDDRVALEWTTTGTSADGATVEYDGVSILDLDGEHVTRFWAYFNPADLGHQMQRG